MKTSLDDEKYVHMLAQESVVLRAQNRRHKDMEALKHARLKQDRLDALVVAAEVTMGGLTRDLNTERRINTSLKTRTQQRGTKRSAGS